MRKGANASVYAQAAGRMLKARAAKVGVRGTAGAAMKARTSGAPARVPVAGKKKPGY